MKLSYQIITFFAVVGLLGCSEFMFSMEGFEFTKPEAVDAHVYQNISNVPLGVAATHESQSTQGHASTHDQEETEIHHHHEGGDEAEEGLKLSEDSDESLYEAIEHDHETVVERYLDEGVHVDTQDFITGKSLLHVAVECDAMGVALLLLNRGAHVNIVDSQSAMPLDDAMRINNQDMIELLLKHGAKTSHNKNSAGGLNLNY